MHNCRVKMVVAASNTIMICYQLEVCPYRDSSLGYRDPYVGILVPTHDPLPKGTLGNLVLHRNMKGEVVRWLAPAKKKNGGKTCFQPPEKTTT
jgi:hypothetical protein